MATKIQEHTADCKASGRERGARCSCKTLFWVAVVNYRCEFPHPTERKGETCPGDKRRHQVKVSAPTQKAARKAQTALEKRRDDADKKELPGQRPEALPTIADAEPGTLTVAAYLETWLAGIATTKAKGKGGKSRADGTIDR